MNRKTTLFVPYIVFAVSLFLPWFTYNPKVMGYCWGTQYLLYFLIPMVFVGIYVFCEKQNIFRILLGEFGVIMCLLLLLVVLGTWQEGRNIVAGFRWRDGLRTAQPGFWLSAGCCALMFALMQYHVFARSEQTVCIAFKIVLLAIMILFLIACIFLLVCMTTGEVDLMQMESELYTDEQLKAGVTMIREKVASWNGCKLFSVWYAGDATCLAELDYCNTLNSAHYTQCLVFQTTLRSPYLGGGAWQPNTVYEWTWYLARVQDGPWELLTWGYP